MVQDVTPVDRIREDPKVDREVTLFGYSRGTNIKPGARVHMAGVGDFVVSFPSPNETFTFNSFSCCLLAICSWANQSEHACGVCCQNCALALQIFVGPSFFAPSPLSVTCGLLVCDKGQQCNTNSSSQMKGNG